jgi:hypothetical protein
LIIALLYLIMFCWVIYKLPFFKDAHISFKWILIILMVKILGCYAYYLFYFGNNITGPQGDSYDTLTGSNIMFQAIYENPLDYIKMLFGIHSELETDALYKPYFDKINDWSQAKPADSFFLNDNRTSVRFHAFIRLFSFGHYAVHALSMMIVSFVGQFAFYKAFKSFFVQKEKSLMTIIFFVPSILFWSSGVLKEPLALCLMGFFLFSFFKIFIYHHYKIKTIGCLVFTTLAFFVLKPYVLILLITPLIVFILVQKMRIKKIALFYSVSLITIFSVSLITLKWIFHKDVVKTIVVRQNDFINLSKGGIFFSNTTNYVRLNPTDTNKYAFVDLERTKCKIKLHTKLMYWKVNNNNDTIFVNDNQDTSVYRFVSSCIPSGSAISMQRLTYSASSFAKLLPIALYHVIAKPFFYDSHSSSELVASLENLGYVLFFIFCIIFHQRKGINTNMLYLCISITFTAFLLIGLTTTVMGAIVRYKVPFIPFLLMIPLLYLDADVLKRIPIIKKWID